MNRYDFTQPGGFPLDQGVMQFIQTCIGTAAATATIAGPFAILSGCVVTGGAAGDGMVVVNGEILPFVGGAIQTKVRIDEVATPVVYQDDTARVVKYERVVRFGDDGTTTLLWANFKRNTVEGVLARLDRVEGLLRPFSGAGGMVWWKGSIDDIPTGWREVEAMRGKFPMAAKAPDEITGERPAGFDIGDVGGSETHTLSTAEIPNYQLHLNTDKKYLHHGENDSSGSSTYRYLTNRTDDPDGPIELTVNSGGDGQSMSIINPYNVGCWIEPIPGTF